MNTVAKPEKAIFFWRNWPTTKSTLTGDNQNNLRTIYETEIAVFMQSGQCDLTDNRHLSLLCQDIIKTNFIR